jgi:hypothetical protein
VQHRQQAQTADTNVFCSDHLHPRQGSPTHIRRAQKMLKMQQMRGLFHPSPNALLLRRTNLTHQPTMKRTLSSKHTDASFVFRCFAN